MRHVVVVAGSLADWNSFGEDAWRERIAELRQGRRTRRGDVADHPSAGPHPPADGGMPASITRLGRCTGVVDPQTDGRQRLVEAVNVLRRDGRAVTDANLADVINSPSACDPIWPSSSVPTTSCRRHWCGNWPTASWSISTFRGLRFAVSTSRPPSPSSPVVTDVSEVSTDGLSRLSRLGSGPAHLQARRGRPDRGVDDRTPRQGARRCQGRAQDDVEVRRPARAAEPRAAPPGARPQRSRHRQPSRVDRVAGATRRRSRPPHQRHGDARSRRSDGPGTRARTAPLPHARRCPTYRGLPLRPPGGPGLLLEVAGRRGHHPVARRMRSLRRGRSRSSRSTWITVVPCAATVVPVHR